MSYDTANGVLALAVALRVFAPDVRALARWLLGVGVRVGTDAMARRGGGRA
ncbi:hypothetical protein [Streptomyces sp. NPDC049881]|uniref:hypothetical protein n=1 Tax=unclassified Streptomyces TaxID=2593676 RepID=UPI00341A647C